jgi:hypothetical protein
MSPDAVAWSDWPARRTPRRAAVAAVVIVGTVGVVLVLDPLLAVVGAVVLLSATAEILLPSRYSLDADGVTIGRALWSRRQPWSKLQGWSPAPDGFVLQGAGSRALLRRRRTLRLRCPTQQVAVAAALHRHLG